MLSPSLSDETNGDQEALIEALKQALSAFVDRLDQAKGRVESDKEHED